MNGLLFLSHRIPYPPNKGDKIRSYHLLKYLSERYEVYLGTFVDDADDWQYREYVEALCKDSYISGIDPRWARVRSLKGLLTGQALTLGYYGDEGLQAWVNGLFDAGKVGRVLVFSSAMAQYIEHFGKENLKTVIDFVDIDSDKWAQYSGSKRWPESWLYRREADALFRYERQVAQQSDVTLFVSEAESELFKTRVPEASDRVTYITNGVDTDYFSPELSYPNPYLNGENPVVFTGAMDYWPNVDAVTWFAREVFPQVVRERPEATFYIVGARPGQEVRQLANLPNIRVTGTVDDIRPYLFHARVAVAPLRVARGIQNKVLEAMSMAKPVIATGMALEGIISCPGVNRMDGALEFSAGVSDMLNDGEAARRSGSVNRDCVLKHYNWDANLQRLIGLIENGLEARRVA